jgi:hypothetical protein
LQFKNVNFVILDFTEEVNCILIRKSIGSHRLAALDPAGLGRREQNRPKPGGKTRETPQQRRDGPRGAKPEVQGNVGHKNDAPIKSTWIKKGKNFQIFKEQMRTVPNHQGKPICVKLHVKRVCSYGDGCQRKLTHMNKFDEATTAAFDAWVSKCRCLAGN